ncbi:MAG TPA: MMPL family transporter [Chitinophagales bacterium]|nr:MMPL family transporter [Chitinophagales bacterium]
MKFNIWKWVAGMSPKIAIGIFSILTTAAIYFSFQLTFSYDYEDFFPKGDKELDFYYLFRDKFEHDDNFLLIGLQPEAGVFDANFLAKLDSITQQTQRLESAEKVFSITNYNYYLKTPFGFVDYPAVHIQDSSRYAEDSTRLKLDERVNGKLISQDFTTTVVLIKTPDTLSQIQSEHLIAGVKNIMADLQVEDFHLLGKANFQVELIRIQQKEFTLYALLSFLLVGFVTYLMFRKWWCVFIAMLTVGIALIVFTGILGASGIEQNVMSTLFPIVIIIIGISDAVHFIGKYIVELRKNANKNIALYRTLKDIGFATFLTAVTSAIGFATMLTSNVPPIKFFGILSALGVLIVYFVVLFFISPVLKLFSLAQLDNNASGENKKWYNFLHYVYLSGKNYPRRILLISGCILLIFTYGITQISTDIHLEAGMPKNERVTTDFNFFETHFNGFRPFEIAAVAQNGYKITDPVVLQTIEQVEQYAKQYDIINGVQSITMIYKSMHRAYNGDNPVAYQLPEDTMVLQQYNRDLSRIKSSEMHLLLSEDKRYGRISATLSDAGTDSIRAVQNDIQQFINKLPNQDKVQFTITGTGIIFDKNTQYLRRNIISGVLLAFLCIGIVMAFMFRDWKMVLISIIPNILPLAVCAGIMGLLKIELDAPTSIIFGISYGIAVDDTIHFLSKFRIERLKGHDVETAIRNTFEETGKAVFIMSVILFFGFSILMLSPTAATFNIGLLTGITLFSAVWPDVYLLPIMLRKWMK